MKLRISVIEGKNENIKNKNQTNLQHYGGNKWSVGETHSITYHRNAERTLVDWYITSSGNRKTMATMAMIMWKSTKKQEHLSRNANQIRGEEKLPFLLTRFIRKENLDKRGCKITEIVERHKIKADPVFGDQFISGMNCVCVFFMV